MWNGRTFPHTLEIGIGAQMAGLAQGAFEHAVRYAQERQEFGRAIAESQGVQFELAEMATQIEAARLLTYNADRLRDDGLPFVKESAMAKLFASRAAERVASKSIEIHGGYRASGCATGMPMMQAAPRERVHDLLGEPLGGGVRGHVIRRMRRRVSACVVGRPARDRWRQKRRNATPTTEDEGPESPVPGSWRGTGP